jgi:hypothetical protein
VEDLNESAFNQKREFNSKFLALEKKFEETDKKLARTN